MNVSQGVKGSAERRRSLFIWGAFCGLAGVIFVAYVLAGLAAGRGELVMPLDDVYIHFQYARQFVAGQPYVYNPGQPPSSGATSFLYPYLLAIGYALGFQGLNLGFWGMFIGALSLLGATWLVYRLAQAYDAHEWIAVLTALAFALTGAVSWHFMSGMETGLAVLFTLWTLYAVVRQSFWGSIGAASLLALIRPEGGILAVLTVVFWLLRVGAQSIVRRRRCAWLVLFLPVLATGVQPLVNLLFTGSPIASGNSAKSLFGIVPPYPDVILARIIENFIRTWAEFATSTSPREGLYIAYPIGLLAFVGLVVLLNHRERRLVGALILMWLLAGTLAVATLDTAFWHFKRYQMPFMALFFPLAAWGCAAILQIRTASNVKLIAAYTVSVLTLALTLWTGAQFLHHFALNANYIYLQPLQMARWLEANTAPDSVVAVHDTGLMRYLSGRTTIDMVGLTTPGAAAYWRNGPGSVAEFLMQERPDYIASYGHGHGLGLGMLADTSLYGEPLAGFPVALDERYNVALAGEFQGIYRPDWENTASPVPALQPSILNSFIFEHVFNKHLDVANISDETFYNYRWRNTGEVFGFPTEIREFNYVDCGDELCRIIDGARLINGEESFDLRFPVDSGSRRDILLITRLHPTTAGTLDVYVNDEYVATRWIPALPGQWLEIATFISRDYFWNPMTITIVPHVPDGFYVPAYHVIYYEGYTFKAVRAPTGFVSSFQNGAIILSTAFINYQPGSSQVEVNLDWYTEGNAQGDYVVFVHLYNEAGELVAQADERPGNGTLPPGNWLPGIIHDTMEVDVSTIQPGRYQVAIGLYDPITFERLAPSTGGDADNRLFIGEVEIPPHG